MIMIIILIDCIDYYIDGNESSNYMKSNDHYLLSTVRMKQKIQKNKLIKIKTILNIIMITIMIIIMKLLVLIVKEFAWVAIIKKKIFYFQIILKVYLKQQTTHLLTLIIIIIIIIIIISDFNLNKRQFEKSFKSLPVAT